MKIEKIFGNDNTYFIQHNGVTYLRYSKNYWKRKINNTYYHIWDDEELKME